MATPKIVQRQLEAAEALAQSMQQPAQPVVTDASQLLTQTPAESAAQELPPTPAPAPAPTTPTDNWEQKFRTMQGMYNAEVPQLRTQVKTYESEMTALKEQVRALTVAVQSKPTEQQAQPDPRDVESFGADMIEMVQRYATKTYEAMRAEFASFADQLDRRLKAVEETVTGVSKKADTTMEAQFYATLNRLVPDWEQINKDATFLAWLGEADPVYRVPRQAALDAAHQRGDVEGVAAVFNTFKASRPSKPSAALASQVSPGTSGGAAAPTAPGAKPMIAQKFVQQFFSDQAKGRYRGREEEAARIEAEINQAAAEGRIV